MLSELEVKNEGVRVFETEIAAMEKMKASLGYTFVRIANEIFSCKGKLIVTGMGKPGHIAKKLAATFSSLGTPSFFLHPADAMHGDLGMVSEDDLVLALSYSGESDEIIKILPSIKFIGAKIIAISGNPNSTLVKHSNIAQILPVFDEACHLHLAPTSSTTVVLAYGDALAVTVSEMQGFKKENFGLLHPAGSLGKKLLFKVKDLMAGGDANPVVNQNDSIKSAIFIISRKKQGMVSVIDDDGKLVGLITDGDVRRLLENEVPLSNKKACDCMTKNPFALKENTMAVEALGMFKVRDMKCAPVVDESNFVTGGITVSMIVNAGIVLYDNVNKFGNGGGR